MPIEEPTTPIQTKTKTKINVFSITTTITGVLIIAGLLGLFTGSMSYAMISGSAEFKAAAGKKGGPGGGGKVKLSLEVSLATIPVAQSVIAGTRDHVFANIILSTVVLNSDVEVHELVFSVTTSGQANPTDVSNFGLFDDDVRIATINDPDSDTSTKTLPGESAVVNFVLVQPIQITKGTSKVFSVKGNIASSASDGDYQVGIKSFSKKLKMNVVEAYIVGSNRLLKPNYQFNNGAAMTFISSGQLTITQDINTPDTGLMPANSSDVPLAAFVALVQYEDIMIEKMYITGEQVNNGGWDQVDQIHLYVNGELTMSITPTSTDGVDKTVLFDLSNNPITVLKDNYVNLTFEGDTADSNGELGSMGASGEGIKLKINSSGDVTAKGTESGRTVDAEITYATANPKYLFRSIPIVRTNDLLGSDEIASDYLNGGMVSNKSLYAFSMQADSTGDVGLSQASFKVVTNNVDVSNFVLMVGNNVVASADNVISEVVRMSDINYTFIAGTPSTIFTLKADVSCTGSCSSPTGSGGVLIISMLGDDRFPNPLPNSVPYMSASSNFIWTDFWRTPILEFSSTTAIFSEQWSSGHLVPLVGGDTMPLISAPVYFSR